MKYKYNIKNLDCANCAKKIEEKLNKDKNIKNAIVNFSASTVSVETDLEKSFEYVKQIRPVYGIGADPGRQRPFPHVCVELNRCQHY